jgi:hypothetical protein
MRSANDWAAEVSVIRSVTRELFCVCIHGLEQAPSILSAFAKLLKAIASFVMPVCPAARRDQLGVHWTDFQEI